MSMRTLLQMKNSRRLAVLSGGVERDRNQIMVRFQYSRLLRLVARAAFLAVVIIYLPWHRACNGALMKTWEASFLPEFLHDFNGIGLLTPDADRAVFVGDHSSQIPHAVENPGEPVNVEDSADSIGSRTLDFVIATGDDSGFRVADSALKIGGVAVVQIGLGSDELFRIRSNFWIVYVRRFSSTVIPIRKDAEARTGRRMGRRLLAVPEEKMEALNGLEDVALEPPEKGQLQLHRLTRYLPDLLGDSLEDYRRRVFVDVGPAGRPGSELWFARLYPTRNLDFEIIRVDVNDVVSTGDSRAITLAGAGSMTEWLRRNVRDEDFVVMKAEAETVEEIVKGRAIALVDELFLECRNQWQTEKGGVKSRRAYWECLALYGYLRDEGVAVHQWWD